eukprot:7173659-Karenia_brevis.AAC.1
MGRAAHPREGQPTTGRAAHPHVCRGKATGRAARPQGRAAHSGGRAAHPQGRAGCLSLLHAESNRNHNDIRAAQGQGGTMVAKS